MGACKEKVEFNQLYPVAFNLVYHDFRGYTIVKFENLRKGGEMSCASIRWRYMTGVGLKLPVE